MHLITASSITRQQLSFVVVCLLAFTLGGCSSGSPAAPTPTFTLTGAVSEGTESGPVPIEGAQVTEARSGLTTSTDANGLYSISGLPAISSFLTVSFRKDDYVPQTLTVYGNQQLNVSLERAAGYYHTLSGVVFEITPKGQVPIEGVELYCDSCGSPLGHTSVYTDANGSYRFEWTSNGAHRLFITKASYRLVSAGAYALGAYEAIDAPVRGDTRFDIELEKR